MLCIYVSMHSTAKSMRKYQHTCLSADVHRWIYLWPSRQTVYRLVTLAFICLSATSVSKYASKCDLSHIFLDVDECRTMADPCRGDMHCVNQNGGYLCIPRGIYSQPFPRNTPRSFSEQSYPEETYPDRSLGYPETFVPNPPPVGPGPSYPIVSRSAPCFIGYTAGADGTCVGEFVSCAVRFSILCFLNSLMTVVCWLKMTDLKVID